MEKLTESYWGLRVGLSVCIQLLFCLVTCVLLRLGLSGSEIRNMIILWPPERKSQGAS